MNLLKEMFYDLSDRSNVRASQTSAKKEKEACDALEKTLTEEQQKLFENYYLQASNAVTEEYEKIYEIAFKDGFFLAMQIFDCKA